LVMSPRTAAAASASRMTAASASRFRRMRLIARYQSAC
jgi:hypothetical protein